MKINKLILAFFIATVTLFVACEDYVDTETISPEVPAGCQGVFFPSTNVKVFELEPTNPTEITLSIGREISTGAVEVPIIVKTNDEDIYNVPATVAFADGDTLVTFKVTFPNAAEGIAYNLELAVEGSQYVNPYLAGIPTLATTVTRVKWTPVAKPMVYVDGTIGTLFGVDFLPMYVDAEKAEFTGIIRYRFKNAYDVPTGDADPDGIFDGYPYNDPGDFDETKDYYTVIEIDTKTKEVFMFAHQIGVSWSDYGMFSIGSVYKNLSDDKAKYPLGKFKDDIITFDDQSLFFSMANYKEGAKYVADNPTVIYLTKEIYIAANMKISDFNEVEYEDIAGEVGVYETTAFSSNWNQTIAKAIDIDAENKESEYKNLYYLADLYSNGLGLAFYYKEGGLLKIPAAQPTGVSFMGNHVFMSQSENIKSGVEVAENGVTVYTFGISFHYADGTIVGDFAEKYYYSKDAVTFSKADYIGSFTLTGPSMFENKPDAKMKVTIAQGDTDNKLVITGVTYAAEIVATYDPATATMSFAPQPLADYGDYDMTLYTYDGGVSTTSPIELTVNVLGNLSITPTSVAFGYLIRSEVAGGWVSGYANFVLTRLASKLSSISMQSVSSVSIQPQMNYVEREVVAQEKGEPNFKVQGKMSPKKIKSNISVGRVF